MNVVIVGTKLKKLKADGNARRIYGLLTPLLNHYIVPTQVTRKVTVQRRDK